MTPSPYSRKTDPFGLSESENSEEGQTPTATPQKALPSQDNTTVMDGHVTEELMKTFVEDRPAKTTKNMTTMLDSEVCLCPLDCTNRKVALLTFYRRNGMTFMCLISTATSMATSNGRPVWSRS